MRIILFTSCLLLLLSSCGVPPAQAPRDNVQAIALKTFPKQNWRLVNNRFFLWREDLTPDQISRAQAIGKEIDDLDGQAMPLNRRHKVLEDQVNALQSQIRPSTRSLQRIKPQFDNATRDLATAQTNLTSTQRRLDEEANKPAPDANLVSQYRTQIAVINGQITLLQRQVAWLKPEKERLEREIAALRTTLDPIQSEMDQLEAVQLDIELKGRARVDEIMQVVDWYKDQPSAVVFQFETDGTVNASIANWNLGDDAGLRNFSTKAPAGKKPTMGKVTYTELGGIFEFEAYVYTDDAQNQLRETYSFRIGRIKYDNTDGRNFFGGEMSRTRVVNGTTEVRKGYAKLVDKNN